MTIEELTRTYPSVPWLEYMNKVLESVVKLESDEIVNVKEPRFLFDLEKLLSDTPRRTLANYALWRVVRDSIDYLGEEVRKRQLEYWTEITGETEREPRYNAF